MVAALLLVLAPVALAGFHVKLRNTDFCVDIPDGEVHGQLQLWSCAEGNTNQAWSLSSTSRAPGNPTKMYYGDSGWCIGIEQGSEST